jgi:iron(III) transport system permease protein
VFVFTELSSTQLALKNTVILGTATATAGTILALVIAYVTTRRVIAGSRVLGFLATAPVAVPGIVLGVGLFLSYTRPALRALRHAVDSADRVPHHQPAVGLSAIAGGVRDHPSGARGSQPHPRRQPAADRCGGSRRRLLRTGVIATWCFIFIGVMRELSAAIILFTSQTKVLSVLIYDLNESGDLAAISVLGIAMLVITFAVVLAVNRIPVFGGSAGARLRNS